MIIICSGGHLNPAVTFALCLLGREKWRKFPVYFLAQTIGSFLGAAIIFGLYYGEHELLLLNTVQYNTCTLLELLSFIALLITFFPFVPWGCTVISNVQNGFCQYS